MKKDYTKFPEEQLEDLLKDLKFQLIKSHSSLAEGKKRKHGVGKIRKEIARIKTEKTRKLKNNE